MNCVLLQQQGPWLPDGLRSHKDGFEIHKNFDRSHFFLPSTSQLSYSNGNVTTKHQAKIFPKAYKEIEAQRIISNYGSNSSTLTKLIESLWFIDEPAYQNILTEQMSSMSHQCNTHFAI